MPERTAALPAYLERALELVQREAPLHFLGMRERLGARAVSIRIADAEPLRLQLRGAPPWVTRGGPAELEVALGSADLDRFLLGELTLEQGIAEERLSIRGPLDDVLALLDALESWLHGALRSPSAPALHREFLTATQRGSS